MPLPLLPPLLGLELPAPLPDDEPLFCRWVELPDVLPDELPLPLGLSMRWLPLPEPEPLPLVPRSHATTPPATNADTSTAVKTRCLVIVTLLVDVEKTYPTKRSATLPTHSDSDYLTAAS